MSILQKLMISEPRLHCAVMKPSLVIVGLGNPGATYVHTRHNAGFRTVESLAERYGAGEWSPKAKLLAEVSEGKIGEVPVFFLKPQTFMNRSGESVRKAMDFYKLDPTFQVLILSDDCDISLGEIRFRPNGGPGTHNGLKSIVEQIGEGFPRLRIGLGAAPAGADLANWVLSVPQEEERTKLDAALKGDLVKKVEEFVLGQSSPSSKQ